MRIVGKVGKKIRQSREDLKKKEKKKLRFYSLRPSTVWSLGLCSRPHRVPETGPTLLQISIPAHHATDESGICKGSFLSKEIKCLQLPWMESKGSCELHMYKMKEYQQIFRVSVMHQNEVRSKCKIILPRVVKVHHLHVALTPHQPPREDKELKMPLRSIGNSSLSSFPLNFSGGDSYNAM